MNKEIVALVSGRCRGANLQSPLKNPVLITVDIDREGERRVGCPYLKGLELPDKRIVPFCEANSPHLKELLDQMITPESSWQQELIDRQKLPMCYHKSQI